MIRLPDIADDDPVLDHSRLLKAMENTFEYAADYDGVGLTQTKALNRKFAHWMADHSPWSRYHGDELLRINKVLNEWDVHHAMVTHDLMMVAKFGGTQRASSRSQKRREISHSGAANSLLRSQRHICSSTITYETLVPSSPHPEIGAFS